MNKKRIEEIMARLIDIDANISTLEQSIMESGSPCCACCHNYDAREIEELVSEKEDLMRELAVLKAQENEDGEE